MKRPEYTEVICKGFCKYYKQGKENIMCGAYSFLRRNLTPKELLYAAERAGTLAGFSSDAIIKSIACSGCNFLKDGCDFRGGLNSSPCGGYMLIEYLLKRRH